MKICEISPSDLLKQIVDHKNSLLSELLKNQIVVDRLLHGYILFGLILYVPDYNFQSCQDRSSWVKPVLSSGVSCSTTQDSDSAGGMAHSSNRSVPSLTFYQLSYCAQLQGYIYIRDTTYCAHRHSQAYQQCQWLHSYEIVK